jgi:error-prone DNA polymerase
MYIELHARSAFSFLEGSSLPEELMLACARLNMPAMALLDIDGVYGAPRFHQAAKKIGLKAHIGAEISADLFSPQRFRIPLLVSSRAGYQNLCRLITKMKLRAKKGEGAVHEEELQEHANGLICLTGGAEGPLAAVLRHGGIEAARKQVEQLVGLFGRGNVYVELQRHFHREEETRNQWRLLRRHERSRTLRCIHRHPPSPHAVHSRKAAGTQLRASFEIAARDAAAFCRPA